MIIVLIHFVYQFEDIKIVLEIGFSGHYYFSTPFSKIMDISSN